MIDQDASQRPGGETPKGTLIDTTKGVTEWYNFMAKQNVKHVFILLSDNELEDHQSPGLIAAYKSVGVTPHHIPIANEGSYSKIITELSNLYDKEEKAPQQTNLMRPHDQVILKQESRL